MKRYNGQSYSTLKKRSQKEGYLFEDVSFPTDASSLYLDSSSQSGSIEWKRPGVRKKARATNRRVTFLRRKFATIRAWLLTESRETT